MNRSTKEQGEDWPAAKGPARTFGGYQGMSPFRVFAPVESAEKPSAGLFPFQRLALGLSFGLLSRLSGQNLQLTAGRVFFSPGFLLRPPLFQAESEHPSPLPHAAARPRRRLTLGGAGLSQTQTTNSAKKLGGCQRNEFSSSPWE